jgi:hypothetical protein
MYQFTTTTLINSSLDSNGTTAKFAGTSAGLKVARVNNFLKDNIVGSIYKRPYTAGVKEVAQITIPTVTAGLVIRVEIQVELSNQKYSDYASSNSINSKKPVYVEVISTATAATDATNLKNAINGIRDRFGYSYVTATTSSADLIITATDADQKIKSIKVFSEAGFTNNSLVEPAYTDVSANTFSVTTTGKPGFGDDVWMTSNIVIPTYANTRFYGISKDERPVIGGNYTQYTIRYQVANSDSDGIVGGGTSITTHVFYVLSSLVTSFEAAIIATGKNIDTIGAAVTAVTIAGNTFDLSSNTAAGITLTYTSTPSGVTGGVWSLTGDDTVAGTLDATKIAITPAGLFTVATGHGVDADDTIGVQVVVDGYTKTGVITFQD